METVRLRSKIGNDGHLRVDIPTALPQGEVDIVIVLVPSLAENKKEHHVSDGVGKRRWDGDGMADDETEDTNWQALSVQMLERAYGENEPEYSADLIKEANPEYDAR